MLRIWFRISYLEGNADKKKGAGGLKAEHSVWHPPKLAKKWDFRDFWGLFLNEYLINPNQCWSEHIPLPSASVRIVKLRKSLISRIFAWMTKTSFANFSVIESRRFPTTMQVQTGNHNFLDAIYEQALIHGEPIILFWFQYFLDKIPLKKVQKWPIRTLSQILTSNASRENELNRYEKGLNWWNQHFISVFQKIEKKWQNFLRCVTHCQFQYLAYLLFHPLYTILSII